MRKRAIPSRAQMDAQLFEELQDALLNIQASHYMSIAGATILLYDYLLAFADEVAFVWPSPLSLPIVLYYMVRYLPIVWTILDIYHLAAVDSTLFCKVFATSQVIVQAFTYVPATWLLSIRVLALYPGIKWLPSFVYAVLSTTLIASFTVAAVAFASIIDSIEYSELFQDCCGHPPKLVGVGFLLLIPIEALLLLLQLYHNYLQRNILRKASVLAIPLLVTLYTDGAIYFFVVVSMRLLTGLLQVAGPSTMFYLSLYMEFCLTSTSLSRLFIHLRTVAQGSDCGDENELTHPTTGVISEQGLRPLRIRPLTERMDVMALEELPQIEKTNLIDPFFIPSMNDTRY